MNYRGLLVVLLSAFTALSLKEPSFQQNEWTSLFNGQNLSGWDTYLGPPLDETGKKLSEKPIGLNNDPNNVFTVIAENGKNIIRISGESWGGISTTKEYENFHLQLKFKWGSLTWGQKKGKKKDSGLLYFAVGKHGADYGAWMRSQEFQIEEGNCGDYWGVAGGMVDIPAVKRQDNQYVYNRDGQINTFSATSKAGRHCSKQSDKENASGEWNTLDLYCSGDTSLHVMNGKLMMALYNSRQMENDIAMPLKKGKLQIQSEGAEVFYKDIKIRPLAGIPAELLK